MRHQFSLARLFVATAFFAGSLAAIALIAIPATDGAFDGDPFGFYAILIGVVLSSLCVGLGIGVLVRRIWPAVVSTIATFVAIVALIDRVL